MMDSFTPGRIGTCEIRNRFVMTAANLGWCKDGFVNDRVTAFYRERARGGTGLIIAGAAGIDPHRVNQVGMMQIYDDRFIPPMKKLTEEIHGQGAKIFLQLMHAGAYARSAEHNGARALAPSAYRCAFTGEETLEASQEEIEEIIREFGEGAQRAKAAGFDGVEIIGSAGYLVSEFLSAKTNHRTDRFGGGLSGRITFLLEVIREIRRMTGAGYPLIVRLSGTDFVEGGNGPEEFLETGRKIAAEVDAINVTGGWHETQVPQITWHVPRGQYLYLAKALRDAIDIPVIGCNRLDAETARQAVENGFCDFAGLLRGLIADPYLVRKVQEHAYRRIRPCLACNQECLERIFSGKELACTVNPFVGREQEKMEPRLSGKRILIIGAGIAGLTCAVLLAASNRVLVCEKNGWYGGSGNVVGRLPGREDVLSYVDYLYSECLAAGVEFTWNREMLPDEVELENLSDHWDHVVIACGAAVDRKDLAIEDGAEVISAEKCILRRRPFGKRIVVLGSGYKAVQTAQYLLSCRHGEKERAFLEQYAPRYSAFADSVYRAGQNSVTLLSRSDRAGNGFGKSIRWLELNHLKKTGITVLTETSVLEIRKDSILYSRAGETYELPCDLTVLAENWKASAAYRELQERYPEKISVIGDACRPGRISEAVRDAFTEAFG